MSKNKFLALAITGAIILPTATFAQATSTATSTTPVATSTVVTCMQNAIEKREMSLITAHDSYASSTKAALTNRMTGLKAAWGMTDQRSRMQKREQAYKAFRTEMQAANNALRNAKNNSWKVFQTDAKSCGVKATGENPSLINGANISL